MSSSRILAGLALVLCLVPAASAAVAVRIPAISAAVGGSVGAAGIAALPSASENPSLVLGAISAKYGTNPDPEAVADLGEGDYAEVRGGVMPAAPALERRLRLNAGDPVAVKIPYLDPGGMTAHEAAVSRRLQEAGGGDLFVRAAEDPELGVLVMEKLAGYRTLDEWTDAREGIGRRTYKRIETQLKRGLAILEKAGIVHSDLKPDNVLIGPNLKIKIVDFGIAAAAGGYAPYPDYSGWRGGFYRYASDNQLRNGPAAFADDRHSVSVMLGRLSRRVRDDTPVPQPFKP